MTASELTPRLEAILKKAPRKLVDIDDATAAHKPEGGGWSKKETLGHLIDSAANNQQRFVRAQFVERLEIASYEQEWWVRCQAYATESWPDLVNLWLLLNRHLLHVVQAMPEDVLAHEVAIGGNPAVPLKAVIEGYLDHMEHHLGQILG
jgi:hypothetical protein